MWTIFSKIRDTLIKRGFKFRVTLPWPGEKGLGNPMPKDRKVTNKEVNDEIQRSLKKEI